MRSCALVLLLWWWWWWWAVFVCRWAARVWDGHSVSLRLLQVPCVHCLSSSLPSSFSLYASSVCGCVCVCVCVRIATYLCWPCRNLDSKKTTAKAIANETAVCLFIGALLARMSPIVQVALVAKSERVVVQTGGRRRWGEKVETFAAIASSVGLGRQKNAAGAPRSIAWMDELVPCVVIVYSRNKIEWRHCAMRTSQSARSYDWHSFGASESEDEVDRAEIPSHCCSANKWIFLR